MGIVVPVGQSTATFIFNYTGVVKDLTWGLGCVTLSEMPPAELAELVYDAFAVGTSPDTRPYTGPYMVNGYTFQGVSVSTMTETGPLVGQYLDANPGSAGANPLPVNCAVMATKNTALGGRKYKGRAYLPPLFPAEVEVNGAGVIDSGPMGTIQGLYDRAFAGLTANDVVPLLHHSDGSAGTVITGFVVGSTIATQRRRLR